MCTHKRDELTFEGILHDPLIRMVMASDGVPAAEFMALMNRTRGALVENRDRGEFLRGRLGVNPSQPGTGSAGRR